MNAYLSPRRGFNSRLKSYLPNVRCYAAKKSRSDESMVAYHNKDITKAASRRYLDNLFFLLY